MKILPNFAKQPTRHPEILQMQAEGPDSHLAIVWIFLKTTVSHASDKEEVKPDGYSSKVILLKQMPGFLGGKWELWKIHLNYQANQHQPLKWSASYIGTFFSSFSRKTSGSTLGLYILFPLLQKEVIWSLEFCSVKGRTLAKACAGHSTTTPPLVQAG